MPGKLVCSSCARCWHDAEPLWQCTCGGCLNLETPQIFDPSELVRRPPSLWRYHESLGLEDAGNRITFGEGLTPLVSCSLDGEVALLKLDFLGPTGSFKDRGTTIMMSKLKEWGTGKIVNDSSGNAGASVAAYAAAAGIHADIFIPAYTSLGKAAQIASYGATLVKISGTREDTADAAWAAAQNSFYASHNWSPHFIAGMKTLAYEIAEQTDWNPPDWVVAPVGGGSLFIGLGLGFADLYNHRIISHVPRLAAVQSECCAPVCGAWMAGSCDISPVEKRETAAEGISISAPVRAKEVLDAIYSSGGAAQVVSDTSIWQTLTVLGSRGFYVEPTSAAAVAGYLALRANGTIKRGDRVAIPLTGSGLKATDKILVHSTHADSNS